MPKSKLFLSVTFLEHTFKYICKTPSLTEGMIMFHLLDKARTNEVINPLFLFVVTTCWCRVLAKIVQK